MLLHKRSGVFDNYYRAGGVSCFSAEPSDLSQCLHITLLQSQTIHTRQRAHTICNNILNTWPSLAFCQAYFKASEVPPIESVTSKCNKNKINNLRIFGVVFPLCLKTKIKQEI